MCSSFSTFLSLVSPSLSISFSQTINTVDISYSFEFYHAALDTISCYSSINCKFLYISYDFLNSLIQHQCFQTQIFSRKPFVRSQSAFSLLIFSIEYQEHFFVDRESWTRSMLKTQNKLWWFEELDTNLKNKIEIK